MIFLIDQNTRKTIRMVSPGEFIRLPVVGEYINFPAPSGPLQVFEVRNVVHLVHHEIRMFVTEASREIAELYGVSR